MSPFTYVWAYDVPPESDEDFHYLYGPDGSWVELFRRAPGYLDTTLLKDLDRPGRYVTIDRWESREAFTAFRAEFAVEFERLDRIGDGITQRETLLGEFETTS